MSWMKWSMTSIMSCSISIFLETTTSLNSQSKIFGLIHLEWIFSFRITVVLLDTRPSIAYPWTVRSNMYYFSQPPWLLICCSLTTLSSGFLYQPQVSKILADIAVSMSLLFLSVFLSWLWSALWPLTMEWKGFQLINSWILRFANSISS
jgi:hypothetical protein